MPEEPLRKAPADGLSEQERRWVRSKDPSMALLQEAKAALSNLTYDRTASKDLTEALLKSNPYMSLVPPALQYEVPTDMEEFFTLRSKRFELQLFSGIHETNQGDFISLVMLAVPIMGWEITRIDEGDIEEGKAPEWAQGWTDDDLETFMIDLEGLWDEQNLQARELIPIMAYKDEDPYEDSTGYTKRKDALLAVLKVLCGQFPFKVHFSESGNIPKEVPDDWIGDARLEEYSRALTVIEARLKENPEDVYALYEKAGFLLARDHFQDAKALLDQVITKEPNMPYAWFALSDLYSRTGKDELALESEEKGLELETLLEGRRPGKADVYDFTPPFNRMAPEVSEEEQAAREDPTPRCQRCDNEFIHITEGYWYVCNMCGASSALEGKGLILTLTSEKQEHVVGEPVWVTLTIENNTEQDMTFSTDDLELISMPQADEVTDDGEDESARDYVEDWIGKLKAPYATGVIPPHGKETMRIDLRKIETLEPVGEDDEEGTEEFEGAFDVPGEHRVSAFLKVTVGAIEDGREPWSETEPVPISIKRK